MGMVLALAGVLLSLLRVAYSYQARLRAAELVALVEAAMEARSLPLPRPVPVGVVVTRKPPRASLAVRRRRPAE